MEDVVENIKNQISNNRKLDPTFSGISKCYLLTTENIRGYMSRYKDNIKGKNVLTIAGSGDQMLNAYLMGASNVTCFDINSLSYHQLQLKKAAIQSLSYEEYISYFISKSGSLLSEDLFRKIDTVLSENDKLSSELFNYLYSELNPIQIYQRIYYKWYPSLRKMKYMNMYFDPYNYDRLSMIIKSKDIDFVNCDIQSLQNSISSKKYDFILLSNICEYIEKMYSEDCLCKFRDLVLSLSSNLSDGGIIQCGYIYDHYSELPIFADKSKREKYFSRDEFEYFRVLPFDVDESFPEYKDRRDTVVVYKKSK